MRYRGRLFRVLAAAGLAVSLAAVLLAGCARRAARSVEDTAGAGQDTGWKIQDFAEEHADGITGAAVTLFERDRTLYEGNFGWSDAQAGVPVDGETVFSWGTASDLLVWVSVMQLAEAGTLDLKTDIRKYLPENFLANVREDQTVTLEHLMNHTAGFQEKKSDLYRKAGTEVPELAESLKSHAPPQVFDAGEVTAYSEWGTALAAYIVERVSGEPYSSYVKTHIFGVLGMIHTSILPDYSDCTFVQDRRSRTKGYTAGGRRVRDADRIMPLYPAGMCTGTIGDFTLFARALLPGESILFALPDTLDRIYLPTDLYSTGVPKNSHGLWSFFFGSRVLGETGSAPGQTASLFIDPEAGEGVCIMTNRAGETLLNRGVPELVFGSITGTEYDLNGSLPKGRYRSARNVFQGPLSFLQTESGKLGASELASPYWAESVCRSGETRVEQPYSDYLAVSAGAAAAELLHRFCFFVSVLGCAVYLIRGALYQFRRRGRRAKERPETFWILTVAEGAGDLLVILLMLRMARIRRKIGHFAASASYAGLVTMNGINLVLIPAAAAVVIWLFVQGKRQKTTHERLPAFVLREVLWITAMLCGIGWQMLPFWVW